MTGCSREVRSLAMERMRTRASWVLALAWVAGSSSRAAGADADSPGPPRFETDAAPILRAYCWKCHGGEALAAGLDMRSLPLLLSGGKSGPAIARGSAE